MSTRSLLTIVALALAPACASDTSGTVIVEGDPVDETVAEGEARGGALADLAFDELLGNDYLAQIGMTGAILASMNDGEIAVADFAVQIVVDDDVFDYANAMIIEHDDANIDLDGVMRFYGVGYLPNATADRLAGDASAEIGAIRGSADPDFTYVEGQVIMHASALVLLDELYAIIGDGEMGDYILFQSGEVDAHLAEAEAMLATWY